MKPKKSMTKPRAIAISQEAQLPGERRILFRRHRPPPKLWKWFKQELAHALNLYFSWARPQERHWHVSPEKPALPEHEKIRPNIFQPRI
jgi:hypothetical protein